MLDLKQAVKELKGVGESVAKKLAKLNIFTVEDLIRHYPRRYDDFSNLIPIVKMHPGLVTFSGQIITIVSRRSFRKRSLSITEAIIADDTGSVKAIWFNQPYLKNTFPIGSKVLVAGKLEFKNNDLALQSPAIELAEKDHKHTARIVAVYPETASLTSRQIRNLIWPLISQIRQLPEILPPTIIKATKLMSFAQALMQIHFPTDNEQLDRAKRRLAFEELFFLILTSLVIKQEIKTESAPKIEYDQSIADQFLKILDFKFTDAQRRSSWEILQDLTKDLPMNRLLEGDVGSGKTVVAVFASVMAIAAGYQVALMVPTEILAQQHFSIISTWLKKMGLKVELILSKQKNVTKQAIKAKVIAGDIDLVIGTHALLASDLNFQKLGMVIIDEQHRFGVNQRIALKHKAGYLPHLLSMTATPIPRSLALTIYGDLDLSILDQLPPGRQKIITEVVMDRARAEAYQTINQQIDKGRQVFVVCPLITESKILVTKSVEQEIEHLQKEVFPKRRIASIHGRMSLDEKQRIMNDFINRQIDILVATNMIEVGIDIPNANIMLIESAERFGLASLHQLRGRIGRGQYQSYCFLLPTQNLPDNAAERLKAMERYDNGFTLAQIDLEMRGPGQIYGVRQHGLLDLRLADLTDVGLIKEAREQASIFLQNPKALLKYPYILGKINQLKSVTSLD